MYFWNEIKQYEGSGEGGKTYYEQMLRPNQQRQLCMHLDLLGLYETLRKQTGFTGVVRTDARDVIVSLDCDGARVALPRTPVEQALNGRSSNEVRTCAGFYHS